MQTAGWIGLTLGHTRAGAAAGVFDGFEVIDRFIHVDSTHEPDAEAAAQYEKAKPIFEKCYHSLVDVYEDLARP